MLPQVCRFKPASAVLLAGLLPAAFVVAGGASSPAAASDTLLATAADGLGTVVFAFFAITALAVACLIVGFSISRRQSED
jgi:hypothetical protein